MHQAIIHHWIHLTFYGHSVCTVSEWQLHCVMRSAAFKILPQFHQRPWISEVAIRLCHEIRSVWSIPNPDMIIMELSGNIMMAEDVFDTTVEQWNCWNVKYQQRQACWLLKHSENWEAKSKRSRSMEHEQGLKVCQQTLILCFWSQ